jgi:DNA-binding IclR family transcriptional regulator
MEFGVARSIAPSSPNKRRASAENPAAKETFTQEEFATVKSADRVLMLFETLGKWEREMSHAELVDELDIPKSSLTQLLRTLLAKGWLTQSADKKGYRLGDAFERLARTKSLSNDIVAVCKPVLSEITDATGESCGLHVLRGNETEVVAVACSPERLNISMRIGDRGPLYALSAGKVILAFLPPEMQEEYFSTVEFVSLTPKTISSVEQLRIQIDAIREQRVGYTFEEFTLGCAGMARPILSTSGEILGSINVATPIARYDKAKRTLIGDALDQATRQIEQQLKRQI